MEVYARSPGGIFSVPEQAMEPREIAAGYARLAEQRVEEAEQKEAARRRQQKGD